LPPNRRLPAPACGSKTPPSHSRTPQCPTTAPDGRTPNQNPDSSEPSPTGPGRRSPPQQTAPSAAPEATRQSKAEEEIQSRGRSRGNCSSMQYPGLGRINSTMIAYASLKSLSPTGCYDTASLAAFTGRALMIFRAGFALKIVGSFVNGLMPFRAFIAGFLMTTNLANPGTKKAPVFLSSL